MKLKYYLRGLGIGIIIAVIIMIIAFRIHGSEMSDEQVIERAQELGMVMPENGAVADLRDKQQEEETKNAADDQNNTDTGENAEEKKNTGTDKNVEEKKNADAGENADAGKADQKNGSDDVTSNQDAAGNAQNKAQGTAGSTPSEASNSGQAGTYVTFVVSGGEYSDKISQNLQTAGLIEDSESFNKWLQETDYDNLIQPGTFQIPVGSTWDEIAVILTTKEENQGQTQGTQPVQP